ncbi:MAG: S-layer family protein, partial [Moorea sp. SIO3C2]|nr:S-layer family protein [Moorena sp. SIO3C2]
RISTNANSADGGGITIDAVAIAAFNNSDISANALDGFGGRVVVSADGVFGTAFRPDLTPNSDITATSARGSSFDGEVVINTPDVDPSRGLIELPETLADVSDQVMAVCEQGDGSSLVITGAGGLPQQPYQTLQSQTIWSDMRLSVDVSNANSNLSDQQQDTRLTANVVGASSVPINEAQAWWVNDQGNVMLGLASSGNRTTQPLNCGHLNKRPSSSNYSP